MVNTDWVHDLKVVELKEECKKRGLAVSGKKAELVERLEEFIKDNEKSEEPAGAAASEDEGPAAAGEAGDTAEDATEGKDVEAEEEEEVEEAVADKPAGAGKADAEAEAEDAKEADEEGPAEEQKEEPAAMEAEQAEEAEEADKEPEPAAAAAAAEPEQQQEKQQPAAMEEDKPAAPAPAAPVAPTTAAAAADVDLDYGEESEGEGAAAAEEPPASKADEGSKRKREEEASAARRGSAQGAGSADRPSKLARNSSGFTANTAEKGAAPAPEDVPAATEPATRALRIDGFVRPFTERQVRELLSETGQVLALWMPSIKTHCYAVFESKAQAEETRRATYQVQWPATNPKRLAPRFVPLAEAETAIGTGAGNPDFRLKRMEEDGEEEQAAEPAAAAEDPAAGGSAGAKPESVPDRSKREWNLNRRSPSPPAEGVRDLREMLSRRLSGRSGDPAPGGTGVAAAAAAAAAASAAAGGPRGGRGNDLPPGVGMLPPGLGVPADRRQERGERDIERRLSGRDAPRQEERVLTLDELFKKTTNKPCIYWLPLTDEQVAEKKQKAAEAAAAAAGAAAPAPAAAAAVGEKPAENGTAAAS